MFKNIREISVGIAVFLAVALSLISLWTLLLITVPFTMCILMRFDYYDSDAERCAIAFAIALDIFAFYASIWFGIAFLVVGFVILLTFEHIIHPSIPLIVLYNIGVIVCADWSFIYALPSLIAIALVLINIEDGFMDVFFMSMLSVDKQIEIIDKRLEYYEKKESKLDQFDRIEKCDFIAARIKSLRTQRAVLDGKRLKQQETRKQQEFRKKYINADMERIEQILGCIPLKIQGIIDFNGQLQNTINEYESKANIIIEEAYKDVLKNSLISKNKYFKHYEKISQQYSLELNPVVATACDTPVRKIASFIQQKQEIINKNNADIEKYNQMMQKLQKQYNDELALQKIKELNKDVSSKMEDVSDIANQEIKNSEIQNIISDINVLDKEVDERRHYEIQFGQIEV